MATGIGGGRQRIGRQVEVLTVLCSDLLEASDVIDFSAAAGGIIFVGESGPTSVAVHVSAAAVGPFVPLLNADGDEVILDAPAESAIPLPDELFGAAFCKLVGEGECTLLVTLKG